MNQGSIYASHGSGVWLQPGVALTNMAGGTIIASLEGVFALQALGDYTGTVSVINDGFIGGRDHKGVAALSSAVITNQTGGIITGSGAGIYVLNVGSISNSAAWVRVHPTQAPA